MYSSKSLCTHKHNDVNCILLKKTTLSQLLAGFRGSDPADKIALIDAILKMASIVHHFGEFLETIELNPIAVLPEGEGICVLDAVVILKN